MANKCSLPAHALLARYQRADAYTDCFSTWVPLTATQAQYVNAFYTTWVFKVERWILKWAVKRPSTDTQVAQLASGQVTQFAAWDVEDRTENQLLLCDMHGRTRSWLMTCPDDDGGTQLYFGSAVVLRADQSGRKKAGGLFGLLLGFHKIYSHVLLGAARRRLIRQLRQDPTA